MVANTRRYSSRRKRNPQMLTAAGSTRAWRRLRDSTPGKPPGKAILHHKNPRYKGGSDKASNLQWISGGVGNDPHVGRPKGH